MRLTIAGMVPHHSFVRNGGDAPLARRYRAALELLGDCAETSTRPQFLEVLLPGLRTLLHCDEVSLAEVTTGGHRIALTASYPTQMHEVPHAARVWLTRPSEHPWMVHYLRTRDVRAARLSDITPQSVFRKSIYYTDFYRPRRLGFADFATVSTTDRHIVGVALCRELHDFNDVDHELFESMRRPLGAMWRRLHEMDHIRRTLAALPAAASPSDADRLSAAERRVVQLVLAGLANRSIATALGISCKAVEQHLTHVYRRLGVRSRTQLVLIEQSARDPA
jgi:DNA-binding CsgD family transcriptional regulator